MGRGEQDLVSIDGRETAPEAATPKLFLDAAGKPLPRREAMESGRSVGVPGVLAALKLAHDKYGKLPWSELFAPAITLARDGFAVSPRLAEQIADVEPASFTPAARAYFFDPAGRPMPAGYLLTNPALATPLKRSPETDLAPSMRAPSPATSPRRCRTIRAGQAGSRPRISPDYRANLREPVCVLYRLHRVCGAAPPSSGAVTVGQVLALIEPFDLGSAPLGPRAAHRIVEAERLAFADRDRYLADPDFVTAPVSGLLDRNYLDERRALIDPTRALEKVAAGTPPNTRQGSYGLGRSPERSGTSHISIVDDDGNAFSMTTTIERRSAARTMVRGFLLNNQLTDFSFVPVDEDGRPVANRVERGKRPRSSMDPTIVFGPDGLRYVLGSPGGPASSSTTSRRSSP